MKKIRLKSLEALNALNTKEIIDTSGILENKQDPEKIIGLSLYLSNLREEELKQLETLIPQYQSVQKVNIESVQHFPDSIFSLPLLQELALSCTPSSPEVMINFKDCGFLKKITWRNFKSLPSSFYEHTPRLEELWFKNCVIDEIPEGIAQFQELKVLMFEQSNIKKVSSSIFTLPKLKDIDLRSLGIEEITPLTTPIPASKLSYINLSDNLLQYFPKGLLQNLPRLKELYAMHNKMTEVPEEDIVGRSYNNINLDSNALQIFPSFILEQAKKINFLTLDNNQIKEIPENILTLVRQKKCRVGLVNNLIESIPAALEKDLQKYKEDTYPSPKINIEGNPYLIEKKKQASVEHTLLRETQQKEGTCVQIGSDEYEGTGVSPQEHPLKNRISFRQQCLKCNAKNILITYAKFSVHLMSGDVYWDYNYNCNNCGAKDSSSYAENN